MPEKQTARSVVAEPRSAVARAKGNAETAARARGKAARATRTTLRRPAAVHQRMENVHERIQRRAYEIWESEGRPAGREQAHWLQAESEIIRTRAQNTALSR